MAEGRVREKWRERVRRDVKEKNVDAWEEHVKDQGVIRASECMRGEVTQPAVSQIRLVGHQHDNHVLSALTTHIVNPAGRLLERVAVCLVSVAGMVYCKAGARTEASNLVGCSGLSCVLAYFQHQLTGNVVDDNGNRGVADVAGNKAAEALLACRVPQLQPNLH